MEIFLLLVLGTIKIGILDRLRVFADKVIDRTDKSASLLENINPETMEAIVNLADTLGIKFNTSPKG